MYSYTRKAKNKKKTVTLSLFAVLACAVVGLSFLYQSDVEEVPVVKNEVNVPVIALPVSQEKVVRPYKVEATVVLDYFDGSDSKIANMTKFEGTYRANQGIDYAFQEEAFDVLVAVSGEVSDIKEDPLFGFSCTIKSGELSITYQSLKDMKKSVGDKVKQGDALSLASTNIYNKDLGNHLHLVVEKSGVRMDPENMYGKTLEELK